jgi:quinol monooxygenase YgiN
MLERWTSQELLDKHMAAERARSAALIHAVVALWAPCATPTVERFEV